MFIFDGRGAEIDDHGGNWAAMTFPGGGRAVFFGFDHEYCQTPEADRQSISWRRRRHTGRDGDPGSGLAAVVGRTSPTDVS